MPNSTFTQQNLHLLNTSELIKIIDHLSNKLAQAEQKAEQYEQRFNNFFEAGNESLGLAICQGEVLLAVNDAFLTLFGYKKSDDLIGKTIDELLHPLHKAEWHRKRKEKLSIKTKGIKADKQPFSLHIHQPKLFDVDNPEAYCSTEQVFTFYDLTQQDYTNKRLQHIEDRYRRLFEESRDAIYITGVKGKILQVNDAAVELFGYQRKDLLGLNALKLYHNPKIRKEFQRLIEQKGTIDNFEMRLVRKNGEVIDCLVSSTVRRNAHNEIIGYQGIVRDITARKKRSELVKAKELAERSMNMKAQFLANMSHEIRTPMNAVIGLTNLLEDSNPRADQNNYIQGIKNASEHLLVLINDILDFSKIEANKLKLEAVPFSPANLVNNIIQTLKLRANSKKLSLELQFDTDIPQAVMGDPTRLTQILLNLVGNSIKFTPEGGKVELITRLLSDEGGRITTAFIVTDTGIGIAEDKLSNIFDSFTQVGSNTTRLFGGTGLGLAITKKLVDMQGGDISVKSTLGEGTTFTVIMQYHKTDTTKLTENENNNKLVAGSLSNYGQLNFLLVEDNELNQVVATDTIKKWGNNITMQIANNGQEAIALVQKASPQFDLILMDVQMPIMNGIDATQYIRNELKLQTPIIAMTAYATTADAQKTIAAGMNDYISKPFNPKKLHNKIAKWLEKSGKATRSKPENNTQFEQVSTSDAQADTKVNINTVTDFAHLQEMTDNDSDLMKRMLEIMLRETPEEIALMQQACKEQNWQRLGLVAHKFKSAVTYLGMHNMKAVIKQIQVDAQKQENLEQLPVMVNQLAQHCSQAVEEAKAFYHSLV